MSTFELGALTSNRNNGIDFIRRSRIISARNLMAYCSFEGAFIYIYKMCDSIN